MMSYLHTKFHDNWISSFRGVAMTRFWDGRTDRRTDGQTDGRTDGQTDGVTALLDLLSPSATQVKKIKKSVIGFLLKISKNVSLIFLKKNVLHSYQQWLSHLCGTGLSFRLVTGISLNNILKMLSLWLHGLWRLQWERHPQTAPNHQAFI